MAINRDFENLYNTIDDPWSIGGADNSRYNRYLQILEPYAKGSILDIGCGFGVLLSRLRRDGNTLHGLEISETAIAKGKIRFPFIKFWHCDAANLNKLHDIQVEHYNLIICSDLIYYLEYDAQMALLKWMSEHLADDGSVFIAGWCPGGKYPLPIEFKNLVSIYFNILLEEHFNDSQHLAIIACKRKRFVSITIDYETWHPIPKGRSIDWNNDIFQPTKNLFSLFERVDVRATFFVEMGEYFWLLEKCPSIALEMAEQWREAIRRGHDVQLHLHPCWLPETGAICEHGEWSWDWSKSKAADYPGDLTALVRRAKLEIEKQVAPIKPGYKVTCFRAGSYQAQPFDRLSKALIENGIICDSSVFPNGKSTERDFNFNTPYSIHQPYFADLLDPQLRALPAEECIVELPIFTPEFGRRWFIDNDEADNFACRLISYERRKFGVSKYVKIERFIHRFKLFLVELYFVFGKYGFIVNKFIPKKVIYKIFSGSAKSAYGNSYYVSIGHTKSELRYEALEKNILQLKRDLDVKFLPLSEMAELAISELKFNSRVNEKAEIDFQIDREKNAIMGELRNEAQSYYLQEMIPLDCNEVLDLGCGAGYWTYRIAKLYPWMRVTGVDAGEEFINKAIKCYSHDRIQFDIGDFSSLKYADQSFDCIYADNTIEHSFNLTSTLSEIFRVLKDGGVLIAALPVDGLNPNENCDSHTWKTVKSSVLLRLKNAGFTNIDIKEIDTYNDMGMAPYMPSNNIMLYIRAWKFSSDGDKWIRVEKAMQWIYNRVAPTKANLALDARQIITDAYAYCMGYSVALGMLLQREGYDVTWISMRANNHQRGRGHDYEDSHEVIEVVVDGESRVFDAMANTYFPCGIDELLRSPERYDAYSNIDDRCVKRGYFFYNTSYWYRRVVKISSRRNIRWPTLFWCRVK